MTDVETPQFQPGFYDDGNGIRRWHDGSSWTVHVEPGTKARLHQFISHIEGRNATVSIYEDRIEWEKPRLLLRGSAGTEMIPVKSITAVTTQRDGLLNTWVHLTVSGGRMSFHVAHREAEQVREVLNGLLLGTAKSLAGSAAKPESAPPAPAGSAAADDLMAKLTQLVQFKDQGVLSDEEFAAAKARLLGL